MSIGNYHGKFESSNLSRHNVSREIGRTASYLKNKQTELLPSLISAAPGEALIAGPGGDDFQTIKLNRAEFLADETLHIFFPRLIQRSGRAGQRSGGLVRCP